MTPFTRRHIVHLFALLALGSVVLPGAGTGHADGGPVILEYSLANGPYGPSHLTANKDGNVWFTETGNFPGMIGRVAPSGSITHFALPPGSNPSGITSDANGNLWFTNAHNDTIGTMTTSGTVHEYPVPNPLSARQQPAGITMGPDGNIWFTLAGSGEIGRMTPSGAATLYPTQFSGSRPYSITAGHDGNLWFSEFTTNSIGKITPQGVMTEYALPPDNTLPAVVTAGPDGNIWFTESRDNRIGKITPTGSITTYSVPTQYSYPTGITTGPDGNIWFTELTKDQVASMSPDGTVVHEYHTPSSESGPVDITTGPDGGLWFSEIIADQMGTIKTPPSLIAVAGDYCAPSPTDSNPTSCVANNCSVFGSTKSSVCGPAPTGPGELPRWTFAAAQARGPFNAAYGLPTEVFLQCASISVDKTGVMHMDMATVNTLGSLSNSISGYAGVPSDPANVGPTNITGKMNLRASTRSSLRGPERVTSATTTTSNLQTLVDSGTAVGSVTVDNTTNGGLGRVKSGNINIAITGDILSSHWDTVNGTWISDAVHNHGRLTCTAGRNLNVLNDAGKSHSPIGDQAWVSSPGPQDYSYLPFQGT